MHVQEEAHLHQRSTCNKSQSRSRLDYNDVLFISIILTSQKQHKGSSDIHSAERCSSSKSTYDCDVK